METILKEISNKCIECKKCINECDFLLKYGNPKQISDTYIHQKEEYQEIAYECSLCRLCESVCPVKINPADLFLEMRRDAVRQGTFDFSRHAPLLVYEKWGTSKMFTWYGLPEKCNTIFFPGCTFSGTRPDRTMEVFQYLRRYIPHLGIVFDCCTKPSHDFGRQDYFSSMFGEMKAFLLENGVRNVYVACPNCYRVFKDYGGEISVKTVYEFFAANGLRFTDKIDQTVAVHDPCPLRFESMIHKDIRELIGKVGLSIAEMKHAREETLCCGEGGDVAKSDPAFSTNRLRLREAEVGRHQMISYCAGCVNHFSPHIPTSHILDLLFEPEKTLSGKIQIDRGLVTYWNRLKLKRRFKRHLKTAVTRERKFYPENGRLRNRIVKRLISSVFPGKG